MARIAVFGIGSFGIVLANIPAEDGRDVLMWGRNQEAVDELNTCHTNKKYLKYARSDINIIATSDMTRAIQYTDIYPMALPIKAIREAATQINDKLTSRKTFIHVAKGIENGTFKRVSEMIEDSILPEYNADISVLLGPSHAGEIVVKQPTTVTVSSKGKNVSRSAQDLFMNDYLCAYTNDDLAGVEPGGALRNIVAVAGGIVAGIGYGDNAETTLMTRSLVEISRLGEKLGTDPMTFLGLGGISDLTVTCTSAHPRNSALGYKLGQSESIDQVLSEMSIIVEGIYVTKSVHHLAKKKSADVPIINALYRVLFENISVKECIRDSMEYDKKSK